MDDEDLQITGIALTQAGGIEVGYVRLPQDVRKNGLVWQHTVQIPRGSDYDEELDDLMDALVVLLTDVLEDEATAEPIDMPDEEDEDEDDEEGEE